MFRKGRGLKVAKQGRERKQKRLIMQNDVKI